MIRRCALGLVLVIMSIISDGSYSASGQMSSSSQDSASASASDRSQIQSILKSYVSAYENNDYAGVVRVWPSLENDKKASKKMKERLERADISQTKLTLDIGDIKVAQDSAIVHCQRSENFVQIERSSYESGDATIGGMPAQRPGPSNTYAKKNVRKSGDSWITMKRQENGWVIDSMTEKKPK